MATVSTHTYHHQADGELPQRTGHKWRIALYSHDTMGLGHKRRNLLIAQTLGCSPLDVDILMISGMGEVNCIQPLPGIDFVTLPALHKTTDGCYQSRRLELSLREMIELRSQLILTAVKVFQPDVLIVDNVPRGAMRELDPTLQYLRSHGQTRCVLGLRDVLDEPTAVHRDWARAENEAAIRAYYDAVWVYGDPSVYDLGHEYRLSPDIVAKLHYTGYLDSRDRLKFANPDHPQARVLHHLTTRPFVLCMVGGGQDGGHLAEAFVQTELPLGMDGVLVTGPLMPPEMCQRLLALAAQRTDLHVLDYVSEPTVLLTQASRVIAMGGYNTTCELLSFQKRSLIVPRVKPRREQLVRARRLQRLGLVDVMHPSRVSARALSRWLAHSDEKPPLGDRIDLNGLTRIPQLLTHLLASSQPSSWQAC